MSAVTVPHLKQVAVNRPITTLCVLVIGPTLVLQTGLLLAGIDLFPGKLAELVLLTGAASLITSWIGGRGAVRQLFGGLTKLGNPDGRSNTNKEDDRKQHQGERTKRSSNSVACATNASATTDALSTVRYNPARAKTSVNPSWRDASRLQCSVARICAARLFSPDVSGGPPGSCSICRSR